jgi:hypothetical protein
LSQLAQYLKNKEIKEEEKVTPIVRHYTYYWKTENAKDLRQHLLILLQKAGWRQGKALKN